MTGDLSAEVRVVWLIRTLSEAREAYGSGSTGDGVRLMPSDYHEGSYRELERVLALMRHSRKVAWHWHVAQRYRWGSTHTIEVPIVRTRRGPELRLPANCEKIAGQAELGTKTARARVYRWDPRVDQTIVDKGVAWITREMYGGSKSRIVLPDQLYRQVMGLPPREQRRERPERIVATQPVAA